MLREWPALVVVCASIGVLGFWNLRHSPGLVVRRAVSVVNANDFSWRNRVAAWEGALRMAAEKPWFGLGWGRPEAAYDHFYRERKVAEGAAIQMNDYLMLGATLGVPALACFGMYFWLCLGRGLPMDNSQSPMAGKEGWLRATCRAGAIVLLVGFWFDGGLFKLATAAVFWVLLELGREDLARPRHEFHELARNPGAANAAKPALEGGG